MTSTNAKVYPTHEQAPSLDEVVKAIHQLDSHTQQNAFLVDEVSTCAASIGERAQKRIGEIARLITA